jgi:DNA-binding NtrC family response regulator
MSVVDDELDIMSLFRDALAQIDGIQVFGFTDSTLALEHFRLNQANYNLVLSDFRIPKMNGVELLREVKAMKPSVKTVLVSAFEVEDDTFENRDCADIFLQKPISISELIEAVETQISATHLAS